MPIEPGVFRAQPPAKGEKTMFNPSTDNKGFAFGVDTKREEGRTGVRGLLTGALKRGLGDIRFSAELGTRAGEAIPESVKTAAGLPGLIGRGVEIGSRAVSNLFKRAESSRGLEEGELTEPVGEAERKGALAFDIATIIAPIGGAASLTRKGLTGLAKRNLKSQLKSVEQKIAPKLTAAEKRIAIEEGRVTGGRGGRLFGRLDNVEASKRVQDAAKVVNKRIKNVKKLDQFEIANKAKNEIEAISKRLAPKLKKIKLPEDEVSNVIDRWDRLKVAQQSVGDWELSRAVNSKDQRIFEKTLDKMIGADNLDDVWKIVQNYDKTFRKNIKEATGQSSDLAQFRNEVWRQNRALLRDAMDRLAENLGNDIKKSFNDMSLLYTARNNIINRAEVFTTKKGGILTPSNLVKKVVGGAFVGTGAGGILSSFLD